MSYIVNTLIRYATNRGMTPRRMGLVCAEHFLALTRLPKRHQFRFGQTYVSRNVNAIKPLRRPHTVKAKRQPVKALPMYQITFNRAHAQAQAHLSRKV